MSDDTGPDYPPPAFPSPPGVPASSYQPPTQPAPNYFGNVLPGGGTPPSGDLLTSGHIERTRRNVPAIVLSLVAVLAVIGAGVVYVNHNKKVSSAGHPEQWAPANSIAFFKADLDPANGDKTAALKFEQTFPDAPKVTDPADLKDALLAAAFAKDTGQSGQTVNYATDIKPWLGASAAVAVFNDAQQQTQSVGIIQVTDPTKAKAGMAKLASQSGSSAGGYAVEGDYVIFGDTQAIVDAAVSSARNADIDTNATFAADVATLKGAQLVTGWADLKALSNLATKAEGLSGNSGMMLPLGGLNSLSAVKGRAVVGLRIDPTAAVFEGRLFGQDLSSFTNGSAGSTLGELPAGSVGGMAISGLSDALKKELAVLDKSPLTAAAVNAEMAKIGAQYGIKLPDDALNMLGNEFAVGLDAVPPTGGDPSATKITAITAPNDPTTGLVTAKILAGLASQTGFPLTATAKGSQIVLTNDSGASGSLADSPNYQAAMAGMPSKVLFAAYVNVGAIVDAQPGGVPPDAKHIGSIGTYEGIDGSDLVLGARLTLR